MPSTVCETKVVLMLIFMTKLKLSIILLTKFWSIKIIETKFQISTIFQKKLIPRIFFKTKLVLIKFLSRPYKPILDSSYPPRVHAAGGWCVETLHLPSTSVRHQCGLVTGRYGSCNYNYRVSTSVSS